MCHLKLRFFFGIYEEGSYVLSTIWPNVIGRVAYYVVFVIKRRQFSILVL
jgi:hypothetical protein